MSIFMDKTWVKVPLEYVAEVWQLSSQCRLRKVQYCKGLNK